MTEPITETPPAPQAITLAGHTFSVRSMTDVQLMHIARHARILSREGVSGEVKLEAAERIFHIVHSCVDPEQLEFLVGLEEDGKITLSDLTAFAKAPSQDQSQPVVRRRGRPRKSS